MHDADEVRSPDAHGRGLVAAQLDPLRYDGLTDDPREVAGMMHALMPANARVLDVGCGAGSLTVIANRDKGNTVLAIEPDPSRLAVARGRGIDAHLGTLDRDFLARQGAFDVIVFSDVLEHLPDPDAMLGLACEGLKVGGIILASVPNVAHWSLRLGLLLGRFDYEETGLCDATHLRWFTRDSFRRLFMNRGLEILSLDQSSGVDLGVYRSRLIRRLPRRTLRAGLAALIRPFPTLFGCQHVIAARWTGQAGG